VNSHFFNNKIKRENAALFLVGSCAIKVSNRDQVVFSVQLYPLVNIFLCTKERQDIFLLSALQAFFDQDFGLFDDFYQPGVKGRCPGLKH